MGKVIKLELGVKEELNEEEKTKRKRLCQLTCEPKHMSCRKAELVNNSHVEVGPIK